jgi:hypothetical protein
VTNVILNYVIHRAGANFQGLLDEIFRDHVRIEHGVFFFRNRGPGRADGGSWYQFYASRHDYLRIARAMLRDWHSDTCIGAYLREVYARRQPQNHRFTDYDRMTDSASGYGGQFLTDFREMRSRRVLGMSGYGGQSIMIDFDNARIVVANSVHTNYDWYRLVHQVIRNGRIR